VDSGGDPKSGEITRLLQSWAAGDQAALDSLWTLVHDDLRDLARRHLAHERGNHTLQRTALVNEAFIRLAGQKAVQWLNREQFLSLASKIMRRVLVDYARRRNTGRRGDGVARLSLSDTQAALEAGEVPVAVVDGLDILAIDTALNKLEKLDAAQSRIVELRFFGGLTLEESARVIGISLSSANREWAMARAWLQNELDAK
jgi:RNA polymerase sigma factor (TIGR02999 family)